MGQVGPDCAPGEFFSGVYEFGRNRVQTMTSLTARTSMGFTIRSRQGGCPLGSEMMMERAPETFRYASRVESKWTFRSKEPPGGGTEALPLSITRFGADVDEQGLCPGRAGNPDDQPAAKPRLRRGAPTAMAVEVSYDDGATWQRLRLHREDVRRWTAGVNTPRTASFVSLRARAVDASGNSVEQTVIRAYELP